MRGKFIFGIATLFGACSSTAQEALPTSGENVVPKQQEQRANVPPFALSPNFRWKRVERIDRLTLDKKLLIKNEALNSFRQFGRTITSTLWLHCGEVNPPLAVAFSERVGIEKSPRTRYRFDSGAIHDTGWLNDRGEVLFLGGSAPRTEIFGELRMAKQLRVMVDLPWAREVLIEFNTTGAEKALEQLPCGKF